MSKRWAAIIIVLLILCSVISVVDGEDAKSDCGQSVSTPATIHFMDGAAKFGKAVYRLRTHKITEISIIRFVIETQTNIFNWLDIARTNANHMRENTFSTGIRTRVAQNQSEALNKCCVEFNSRNISPQQREEPFDRRNLSISNRRALVGEELAADAARQAGFPDSEIRMAVAVAKKESSFNPDAVNKQPGGTMRGMWQINDGVHKMIGDWRNPYDNAKMAYNIWLKGDRDGTRTWRPWSTMDEALASLGNQVVPDTNNSGPSVRIQNDNNVQITPPPGCPLVVGNGVSSNNGTGDISGNITLIAELNPKSNGNWQGAVKSDQYWYVAHATSGDRSQIFHRLGTDGKEIDYMTAKNFAHTTSFAVVGNTVYASARNYDIVTFPYQAGKTITKDDTSSTGLRGYVSVDPDEPNIAVVRNGNKYQMYNLASKQPIGNMVRTPTGQRQGFSISNGNLFVLTGPTNKPARVDTYSFSTGQQVGTRDVTNVGYMEGEQHTHREPEGMYGNMMGIKVMRGEARRLRIYALNPGNDTISVSMSGRTRTVVSYGKTYTIAIPSGAAGRAINFALDQVGKPYVFGSHGPNSWDCSGLVAGAWNRQGARIPAQTYKMLGVVPEISRSQMQPGDLTWWYGKRPVGHVGIYLGNNLIVEAPNSRYKVRVRKLTNQPDKVLRPTIQGVAT